MHYFITGGTGFIGTALLTRLLTEGHSATILTRQPRQDIPRVSYITDPGHIASDAGVDCVINLAGASLAGARWSAAYKQEIFDSRLRTTEALVELCERLEQKPATLLSASAIGYYGHHADEALAEDGAVAPGFSQQLCQQWEDTAMGAASLGLRVCLLRLGVVLDRDGGAMVDMARPFRMGVANWLGGGQQWLSWVHRQDVIAAIGFLQERPELSGPFNITAPEAVTSRGFCAAMKKRHRTFFTAPVPAPVMRLMVGEMADELLLNGQRVIPARLLEAGFQFQFPDLDTALSDIC